MVFESKDFAAHGETSINRVHIIIGALLESRGWARFIDEAVSGIV